MTVTSLIERKSNLDRIVNGLGILNLKVSRTTKIISNNWGILKNSNL